MFLFFVITVLLIVGVVFILASVDTKEISENWPKYRCSPSIMPFAGLYGHDTNENFQFCMKNMFQVQATSILVPFTSILATFIGTLSTLIQNANSMRVQLATLVGGVSTITREFQDRITQIMFRTQITASRIRFLMNRMFATFYAMIYMGVSGITAVTSFGDTFLFKFLDTFCFPPETLVEIEGYEEAIPIRQVKIGDRFKKTKESVTAVFQFYADGQPMVKFQDGTEVSTNHYVQYKNLWVQARDHPDAKLHGVWKGGYERPLICVNTANHIIPVGKQVFLDYDETESGDKETMKWVEASLNGEFRTRSIVNTQEYSPSIFGETKVKLSTQEVKSANSIGLGDELSTGKVVGIIKKQVSRVCKVNEKEWVGEATLLWDPETNAWIRANNLYEVQNLELPKIFYSFVVTPTAQIELESGFHVRDYMEIQSPDSEVIYAKKIAQGGSCAKAERE